MSGHTCRGSHCLVRCSWLAVVDRIIPAGSTDWLSVELR